jgi:hypothetical protein
MRQMMVRPLAIVERIEKNVAATVVHLGNYGREVDSPLCHQGCNSVLVDHDVTTQDLPLFIGGNSKILKPFGAVKSTTHSSVGGGVLIAASACSGFFTLNKWAWALLYHHHLPSRRPVWMPSSRRIRETA